MPKSTRDDDDDEERDEPRAKKRRRDEDDEPAAKKRRPSEDDAVDDYDDAPVEKKRKAGKKKGDGFGTIVPYRNGPALASYYCGVFAAIPVVCFLLGPIAIVLGSIGLMKRLANPRAKGLGHALLGIALGILAPPVWVVLWYTVFESMTKPEG